MNVSICLQLGCSILLLEFSPHFGFMDGISQPIVTGFNDDPLPPGQGQPIQTDIILLGRDDDIQRPDWATDGSFLAFRQLKQLVPEFNKFLADNPFNVSRLSPAENSELLGAAKSLTSSIQSVS